MFIIQNQIFLIKQFLTIRDLRVATRFIGFSEINIFT